MKKNQASQILSFKVSVSPNNASLFKYLNRAGKYYYSKRMVQLAQLGLAVEEGRIALADTNSVSSPTPISPSESHENGAHRRRRTRASSKAVALPNKTDQHYNIPENAADSLDGLFDILEK